MQQTNWRNIQLFYIIWFETFYNEFSINVGGTYAISGSLSSITPSSSGYPFTTQLSSNINLSVHSM